MYRLELISNIIGSRVIDKNDPIDLQNLAVNIKRSEKKQGVVYTILLNIEFIEEGRDFLQQAFETSGGVDAQVALNVYERNDENDGWKLRLITSVNFEAYDLGEITLIVNADQNNFQMLIDTFGDVDVDMETEVAQNGAILPEQNIEVVQLHSKTIIVQDRNIPDTFLPFNQGAVFSFNIPNGFGNISRDDMVYMEVSNSGVVDDSTQGDYPLSWAGIGGKDLMEIDQSFAEPFEFVDWNAQLNNGYVPGTTGQYVTFLSDPDPIYRDIRFEKIKFVNAGLTDIDIHIRLRFKVQRTETGGTIVANENYEAKAWWEWRDKNDNIKNLIEIATWAGWAQDIDPTTDIHYSEIKTGITQFSNLNVEAGDKFYIYGTVRVYGTYERPTIIDCNIQFDLGIQAYDGSYINIKQRSVSPVSSTRSILLYEAFERCVQYITGQVDCFRSSVLGRTDLGYAEDGKYALIAYTNGDNLRNKKAITTGEDLPIFASLNELYNFVNMLSPCGIGFETLSNGTQVLVLEPVQYFYDKETISVDLGPVEKVRKKVNKDRYYGRVEIGYTTKMDVSEINAIDEYNTLRRFKIPIANSKNKLIITTALVASGYIIETQRRFNASTKDSKYDTNRFVISLVRDGGGYKSKKNEGYVSIQNVFDPTTVYNIDLTPTQCLQNWFPIIASNLIYAIVNKILTFSYGEYNYNLVTQRTNFTPAISESGDFDISSIDPLYDCLDYVMDAPLTLEQIRLIEENQGALIQLQDAHGKPMNGYISTTGVQYKSDGMSGLTLMKNK